MLRMFCGKLVNCRSEMLLIIVVGGSGHHVVWQLQEATPLVVVGVAGVHCAARVLQRQDWAIRRGRNQSAAWGPPHSVKVGVPAAQQLPLNFECTLPIAAQCALRAKSGKQEPAF